MASPPRRLSRAGAKPSGSSASPRDASSRAKKIARPAFLDPARIGVALSEVADLAIRGGTRVALVGGLALQLYGSDRFTQDVDLLVDGRVSGLRSLGALSFGGVRAVSGNGVPVDLIERDDQYEALYAEALASAKPMRGASMPVAVPVVGLPYLAAMKLVAGRGKDESDLEFILCDSGASREAIRKVVRRHLGLYAVDEIESIRSIAAWRRSSKSGDPDGPAGGARAPRGRKSPGSEDLDGSAGGARVPRGRTRRP